MGGNQRFHFSSTWEQGNKNSPWGDGQGKLNHEAQMLGTDSSSYFSLEAVFLRKGQRVRKEGGEKEIYVLSLVSG